MDLRKRIEKMGFTYLNERPEGLVFIRDGYDKKIIVKEGTDRVKYSDEVRLFEIWAQDELHPFIALKNGKYFDLLFSEVINYI